MNQNIKDILKNSLIASLGLFIFSFGVYLTIQANIGVGPWDAFNLGLVHTFGIKYGTGSITVSLIIICIDLMMKEKIGIGMFLDAILVGKSVDLFIYLNLIPYSNSLIWSILMMVAGMVIMGFSQVMYMKASLGCGPRDTLIVGLKKKITRIPIGIISFVILATVTLIGWLLGGPIGIGTLICAFLEGPIMEWDFKIMKFDPTQLVHQDIMTSIKILLKKNS